jgi:hypothetical protein
MTTRRISRAVAWILVFMFISAELSANDRAMNRNGQGSVRDILERSRDARDVVAVTLTGGAVIIGHIGDVGRSHCQIKQQPYGVVRQVAYADMRLIRIGDDYYQAQSAVTGPRPSPKVWLWVGIAVGVAVVLIYATGLNRA